MTESGSGSSPTSISRSADKTADNGCDGNAQAFEDIIESEGRGIGSLYTNGTSMLNLRLVRTSTEVFGMRSFSKWSHTMSAPDDWTIEHIAEEREAAYGYALGEGCGVQSLMWKRGNEPKCDCHLFFESLGNVDQGCTTSAMCNGRRQDISDLFPCDSSPSECCEGSGLQSTPIFDRRAGADIAIPDA